MLSTSNFPPPDSRRPVHDLVGTFILEHQFRHRTQFGEMTHPPMPDHKDVAVRFLPALGGVIISLLSYHSAKMTGYTIPVDGGLGQAFLR
jgi:hypothetical protein